jgi:hypothetical protein
MMHHTYVLENLADERRTNLLREAEFHRLARRAEKCHLKQTSPLKRITWAVYGLLNAHSSPTAEQGSVFTERVIANGSHR